MSNTITHFEWWNPTTNQSRPFDGVYVAGWELRARYDSGVVRVKFRDTDGVMLKDDATWPFSVNPDGKFTVKATPIDKNGVGGTSLSVDITYPSQKHCSKLIHFWQKYPPDAVAAMCKATRSHGVRLAQKIDNWDTTPEPQFFSYAEELKRLGLYVLMMVDCRYPKTTGLYPETWWKVAWHNSQGAVDGFEVLNEVNLSQYWNGWATDVIEVMRCAWESRDTNCVLIGSSISATSAEHDAAWYTKQNTYGYSHLCTAASYHCYGTTADGHCHNVAAVSAALLQTRLWLTEWNLHDQSRRMDDDQMVASLKSMYRQDTTLPNVDAIGYYKAEADKTTMGGRGGLYSDGKLSLTNQPFFDAWKGM